MAAMNTETSRSEPQSELAGLQPLAQRFKTWRASRRRGQHIPDELWQAATELARIHGLNPTVVALKINSDHLQRRLQSGRAPRRGRPHAPVFVELPAVPVPSGGDERGTVELVQGCGARLILRFSAAGPDDLLPLVKLFLRSRA